MYRKGTAADCRAVYELICELECRQLPFARFSKIYQEQLENTHYYCLVCEQDREIIAVLNLRFEEQLHHSQGIAEILEFTVSSGCRGKGIGREMLKIASQLAVEAGCTQIEAACNQLRTNAHRFYLREGMHNLHFKFSKPLAGEDGSENVPGQ